MSSWLFIVTLLARGALDVNTSPAKSYSQSSRSGQRTTPIRAKSETALYAPHHPQSSRHRAVLGGRRSGGWLRNQQHNCRAVGCGGTRHSASSSGMHSASAGVEPQTLTRGVRRRDVTSMCVRACIGLSGAPAFCAALVGDVGGQSGRLPGRRNQLANNQPDVR